MTCTQALESLLEADLPELSGEGTSPLAQHVRGCARCRTLAGQVLADTQMLASAVSVPIARPQVIRRRQWAPVFVMPATIAAAMLVVAVLRESATTLAPVTVDTAPVQQSASRDSRFTIHDSPVLPRHETPRLGKAFPAPVPLAAVRIEQQPVPNVIVAPVGAGQAVAVATTPGTRAAVLHTSDPKLVVIWLY
jgi:hypothetical protein